MSQEKKSNRLIHEHSPYLLQHAHQPVDWYPWGAEAFERAEKEQKPLFLSIGYSSCHWCHVMAHEAFEEKALAEQMNQLFVNVKVDREEHPEVDALYMKFAQVMIRGPTGWPLTIVATPNRAPFFAATYLPIHSQQGQMGMYELVNHIRIMFEGQEKATIIAEANKMVATLQMLNIEELRGGSESEKLPSLSQIPPLISLLFALADPLYGGLKGEPKFPLSYQNDFLLTYAVEESDPRALFLSQRTLEKMALGGIYDQLGGGFSRYSVDDQWHVPHFEKMLTDQALLIQSYLYGWQVHQKPLFARVCMETCDFVLREMRSKEGAFYTSQDADSEGQEGYFYLWNSKEIESVFPDPIESNRICKWFGMQEKGEEMHGGKKVLYCPKSLEEFALSEQMTPEEWLKDLASIQKKLFAKRKEKPAPIMDETILVSANGFIIHSLFSAGEVLKENRFRKAALEAMHAVRRNFWMDGRLLRWRCKGEAKYAAQLDDYASLTRASLTLFEGTGETAWLNFAMEMVSIVERDYGSGLGGYYLTNGEDPYLLFRPIEYTDGALSSGNALHCENLLRLAQITRQAHYQRSAEEILKASLIYLTENPLAVMYHAWNILRFLSKGAPLLIFACVDEEESMDLLTQRFLPFSTLVLKREGDEDLLERLPFLKECVPVRGKSTLYIYEEGACTQRCCGREEIQEGLAALSVKHFLHPVLHR